ncbi:MAG TPA: hypothetical protein VFP54_09900 [Acidimicrobiales bacterium]|nr:hypothetical protein [Acidimicrobiales bacterium]
MRPGDPSGAEPRRTRFDWVWRGFLALAVAALATAAAFAATGQPVATAKWAVVAAAWGAVGWWLRRLVSSRGSL